MKRLIYETDIANSTSKRIKIFVTRICGSNIYAPEPHISMGKNQINFYCTVTLCLSSPNHMQYWR